MKTNNAKVVKANYRQRISDAAGKTGYQYDMEDFDSKRQKDYIKVTCPKHNFTYNQPFQNAVNGLQIPCCSRNLARGKEGFLKLYRDLGAEVEYVGNDLILNCPIHGKRRIPENRYRRLVSNQVCPKCAYKKSNVDIHQLTLQEWIDKAKETHGDTYDYSKVTLDGIGRDSKATIICNTHGEFEQTFSNHVHLGNGCPKCSHHTSSQMLEIQELLESSGMKNGIDFLVNDRVAIKPLEIDFYLPEHNVGIEFHGSYWHSKKPMNYHLEKLKLCESKGIHLLQIHEYDWQSKKDIVVSRLKSILGFGSKLFARKLDVRVVSKSESKTFLDTYHLQGNCVDSVRIGLYQANILVALMTFGKPRFNKEYRWELIRYCSNGNVVGGASRLLSYFRKNYEEGSIISYANRDFTSTKSNLYLSLGFTLLRETKPNYVWVNLGRKMKVLKRYETQKHMIRSKFPEAVGDTEESMMKSLNYVKVYDSGNLVFVLS